MPSIRPTTYVCLNATQYEHNSAFQCLEIRAALFLVFIMRVHYINNETVIFLGPKKIMCAVKNLNGFATVALSL